MHFLRESRHFSFQIAMEATQPTPSRDRAPNAASRAKSTPSNCWVMAFLKFKKYSFLFWSKVGKLWYSPEIASHDLLGVQLSGKGGSKEREQKRTIHFLRKPFRKRGKLNVFYYFPFTWMRRTRTQV